jgi:hypothetical protein
MIYKSTTQTNCILNTDATKTQAVMSCAPEGLVVSAPLAALTVLLYLQIRRGVMDEDMGYFKSINHVFKDKLRREALCPHLTEIVI